MFSRMRTISCMVLAMILLSPETVKSETLDCSVIEGSSGDPCRLYDPNTGTWFEFYCHTDYICCNDDYYLLTNGCCFNGTSSDLYSDGEIAGLVLNLTALATVAVLTLVICGATYCNDKEDESHLFMKK